ncbi:ROK family protein [Microlunatus parietis]|uniref:Glucokinase n=1 Tax=Microlunatus parietis TaxID=682979 RepID=A0A7Y9L9P4_9ACTN|nr:ROK family protein [Microlunatus parietis]NYE69013.1 glucokinase [Microlunatus parietis]
MTRGEQDATARVAIDLGGSSVKIGVLDQDGAVLLRDEFVVTGELADLNRAAHLAGELIKESGAPVDGAGVALPGVVDRAAGRLVRAHDKYGYLGDRDLRAWGSATLGVPTMIENDARAALLGEVTYGCARGATDAVIMTLGTGIGTAALIDGHLLRGRHDHAAILGGHQTVDLSGIPCNCGNLGCAEAQASTWSLPLHLARDPQRDASALARTERPGLADLFAAPADDPAAADLRTRFLNVWGAALVNLCHAYDPEVVIVSGGVLRARDRVLPSLTEYVHRHLWSSAHRPELITPDRPEDSVLRGLAALAGPTTAARKR